MDGNVQQRAAGNASETESQLQNNVVSWAQDAGLTLPAVKSERTEKEKDFYKFTVRATGTGTMQQIGRFLYRMQTAQVPVRVSELTISTRKEGTDDLSVQMAISTIYLASEADNPKRPRPVTTRPVRDRLQSRGSGSK